MSNNRTQCGICPQARRREIIIPLAICVGLCVAIAVTFTQREQAGGHVVMLPTGWQPTWITLDQSGRLVVVAQKGNPARATILLDQTGTRWRVVCRLAYRLVLLRGRSKGGTWLALQGIPSVQRTSGIQAIRLLAVHMADGSTRVVGGGANEWWADACENPITPDGSAGLFRSPAAYTLKRLWPEPPKILRAITNVPRPGYARSQIVYDTKYSDFCYFDRRRWGLRYLQSKRFMPWRRPRHFVPSAAEFCLAPSLKSLVMFTDAGGYSIITDGGDARSGVLKGMGRGMTVEYTVWSPRSDRIALTTIAAEEPGERVLVLDTAEQEEHVLDYRSWKISSVTWSVDGHFLYAVARDPYRDNHVVSFPL